MALLGRFKKQPNEVINYPIDFSDWLAEREGYSISSYTVDSEPGISIQTHRREGNVVIVVLAGGMTGTTYKVTVRVTTAPDLLVKEVEFKVKVLEV